MGADVRLAPLTSGRSYPGRVPFGPRSLPWCVALAACSPGDPRGVANTGVTTSVFDPTWISTAGTDVDDSGGSSAGTSSTGLVETSGTETGSDVGFPWSLPPGYPAPRVPDDNPMSAAKVELGRHLFYDPRLSSTGTYACATCHVQALAFTDGRATAVGETGEVHRRNAMSLANVGYAVSLAWADPQLATLEDQAPIPMYGHDPIELGLGSPADLEANLATEPLYDGLFAAAFPDDPAPLSADNAVRALAAFERTIISGRSDFDAWFYGTGYGDLSDAAARGWELFNAPPANCFRCHDDFNLSDSTAYDGGPDVAPRFHNIGLYNLDGAGAYPASDPGLVEVTGDPADMGKFKTPTLHNVAVTAPYMHDGSVATLGEVLDHYATGGRTITEGPHAGVGSDSPWRSEFVRPFEMSPQDRADMLAFLESLTDPAFLVDPALGDPWAR